MISITFTLDNENAANKLVIQEIYNLLEAIQVSPHSEHHSFEHGSLWIRHAVLKEQYKLLLKKSEQHKDD